MSYQSTGSPFVRSGAVLRLAVYLRVSTKGQLHGYGLDDQRSDANGFISGHDGCIVVEWFIDKAVSGTLVDRPEMVRLLQAAERDEFDAVLVPRFDRIGREDEAFWPWVWALKKLGKHFISATQPIDTRTDEGWMMLKQFEIIASVEHKLIFQRTNGGRQQKALAGGWPGGPAPFGYSIKDKGKRGSVLEICEKEAATWREIARLMVDEMYNLSETARELNARGMLTRSGKPWTPANLRNRIMSETLDGITTYRKVYRPGKNTTKRTVDGVPLHGKPVVIQLPQILAPERAAAVRKALERRGFSNRKTAAQYLLTGRIIGKCGKHYTGSFLTGVPRRAYTCTGSHSVDVGCDDGLIDADELEGAVWEELVTLLEDPKRLQMIIDEWTAQLPQIDARHRERVMELAKLIENTEEALAQRVVEFALAGVAPKIVAQATAKIQAQLDSLHHEHEVAERWSKTCELREQQVHDVQRLLADTRANVRGLSVVERRAIIELLDVWVYPDTTDFRRRGGVTCAVTDWHKRTGTPVPTDATEAQWEAVRDLLMRELGSRHFRSGSDVHRMLNGVLYRLRTGITWPDLPAEFGPAQQVRERQLRWWKAGLWPQIVALLDTTHGQPVAAPAALPTFKVLGELPVTSESGKASKLRDREQDSRTLRRAE